MDNRPDITLDPDDWTQAQAVAHRAVDDAIAHLRDDPRCSPDFCGAIMPG